MYIRSDNVNMYSYNKMIIRNDAHKQIFESNEPCVF